MRSLLIKNEHLQRKCYVSIGETFKNHMHSHNLSPCLWHKSNTKKGNIHLISKKFLQKKVVLLLINNMRMFHNHLGKELGQKK